MLVILLLLVFLVSVSGQAKPDWTPVFFDDFSSPTLNTSIWTARNNYTDNYGLYMIYMSDEAYVEDGQLVLRTQARQVYAGDKHGMYNYTSGRVDTAGKLEVTYGKFEARLEMPDILLPSWCALPSCCVCMCAHAA